MPPLKPAFETVYAHHWDAIFRYLKSITRCPETAEDLAQESFMRAWRSYDLFRNAKPVEKWLMRIATNAFLDYRRRQARRVVLVSESSLDHGQGLNSFPDPVGFDEVANDRTLRYDKVYEALEQIPREYKELMRLVYEEKVPYSKIAAMQQVPVATVRSRVYRVRSYIRTVVFSLERPTALRRSAENRGWRDMDGKESAQTSMG